MNRWPSSALRITAAGALSALAFSSSAALVSIGDVILNGGFQTGAGATSLDHWTAAGMVNGRLATDELNTGGGSAGFNGFFSSAFAALGDEVGDIGGAPDAGVSRISQSFTLPAVLPTGQAALRYDLVISFRTVFDGQDNGDTAAAADRFSAHLSSAIGLTLFSQSSVPFSSGPPAAGSANNQSENDPFSASILGLTPGTYTITFELFENAAADALLTNTASGIDSVSALATASVPQPGTVALIALGLMGLAAARRLSSAASPPRAPAS